MKNTKTIYSMIREKAPEKELKNSGKKIYITMKGGYVPQSMEALR